MLTQTNHMEAIEIKSPQRFLTKICRRNINTRKPATSVKITARVFFSTSKVATTKTPKEKPMIKTDEDNIVLASSANFVDELNAQFREFFEAAGTSVAAMEGIHVPFSDVGKIPLEVIAERAREVFLTAGGGDCLYLLGGGWDCLGAVTALERELNTTVLANVPADLWVCLKRLNVRERITGYGRLLEDLP